MYRLERNALARGEVDVRRNVTPPSSQLFFYPRNGTQLRFVNNTTSK
jgi:hypothetical protein